MILVVRSPSAFEISRSDNVHMAKTLTAMIYAAKKRLRSARWLHKLNIDFAPLLQELQAFADPGDHRTWQQLAEDLLHLYPILTAGQRNRFRKLILSDALKQHIQARKEHAGLVKAYQSIGLTVEHLPRHRGTDAVFTTDTGEQIGTTFLLANFLNTHRQGEEHCTLDLLQQLGIPTLRLSNHPLEGGDLIYSPFHQTLFVGEGFRNHGNLTQRIAAAFPNVNVVPVRLTQPEHYHLDCCFNVLSGGEIMAYRAAIAPISWLAIEKAVHRVSKTPILSINRSEALTFSTNFVCVQKHVFLPEKSLNKRHQHQLKQWGYQLHTIPYSTFHLSGGSIRCSTLTLQPPQH